jgi:KaiC/GvpD/RAD55 family RecA-like ATPase
VEKHAPLHDHHHAVQFYGSDHSLFTTVSGFLSHGLADGHPCLVIATGAHQDSILKYLRARNINVSKARRTGSLIVLDAEETLDLFMDGDEPDTDRFDASVGRLIARTLEGRKHRVQIRAYGEMVDVLWKQGRAAAAIRLEMLWNMLAQRHGFALLCGYAMSNFHKDTRGFEAICREHTHVIAANPSFAASARLRAAGR